MLKAFMGMGMGGPRGRRRDHKEPAKNGSAGAVSL